MAIEKEPVAETGARLLVKSLEAQGIQYVFGIPGARIDKVFDTLVDSTIRTVVCRHEQNAAFIASGIGRMTGKAGVVLVTSGPGCSNLVTGLATATTEGDPVVAIGGAVAGCQRLKQVHQNMDTVGLFRPITKFSAEIDSPGPVTEVIANAFRAAESGRPGAAFVSVPTDIMAADAAGDILTPVQPETPGPADPKAVESAALMVNRATKPVLLLGLLASAPQNTEAVRALIAKLQIPTVCTYQGAGVLSRDLFQCFGGRIGLFHNQLADQLMDQADLVITVGYYPVEYEPGLWNHSYRRNLIHIDHTAATIDRDYRPTIELTGDIRATIAELTTRVKPRSLAAECGLMATIASERRTFASQAAGLTRCPIHPRRLVVELQDFLSDDMTVCVDMGSFHIWLARYLYSYRPRQILFTNGQLTLGVGLPWAIAASLVRPNEKVLSISGDGGFLFSAAELETAVRLKCNLTHLVLIDGAYDMVRFQQMAKYRRASAVEFGPVDVVGLAEAFGAKGFMIASPDELQPALGRAFETPGPVLIGVPIDYGDNHELMEIIHPSALN